MSSPHNLAPTTSRSDSDTHFSRMPSPKFFSCACSHVRSAVVDFLVGVSESPLVMSGCRRSSP
eukprot:3344585-Prymnesium_polylepis.1